MVATDWASSASAKFLERERAKANRWAQAAIKRQTLVSGAPVFWEAILQVVREQVRVFNSHVGKQVLTALNPGDGRMVKLFVNTDTGPRAMTIQFDSDKPCIVCTVCCKQGSFESEDQFLIDLNPDTNTPTALVAGVKCNAQELAARILDSLMALDQSLAPEPGHDLQTGMKEGGPPTAIPKAMLKRKSAASLNVADTVLRGRAGQRYRRLFRASWQPVPSQPDVEPVSCLAQ